MSSFKEQEQAAAKSITAGNPSITTSASTKKAGQA
jgi:hypothetical protein